MNQDTVKVAKSLGTRDNICIRVFNSDGTLASSHTGHNTATDTMLMGIAHHLVGDGALNQHTNLYNYIPKYISLGTMGLMNHKQDDNGLPAGIGIAIPDIDNEEYKKLLKELRDAELRFTKAKDALKNECPLFGTLEVCKDCTQCSERLNAKRQELENAKLDLDKKSEKVNEYNEEQRFIQYMKTRPGYGADGYDANANNGRQYLGLGYPFTSYNVTKGYKQGDIVTYKGTLYSATKDILAPAGPFDTNIWNTNTEQISQEHNVGIELISPSFPRAEISFRDIVQEYEAELPQTVDVVFSAMISTGALAQFRNPGQDYIFITEVGLWSKKHWEDSGANGLLAAYRIAPPNEKNWDMKIKENRDLLKKQIIKVNKNQVVQVIWKIQLGSIDQLSDIATLRKKYYGYE
nr:MAG TPA: long tail fiber, proximal subunit [Bacteriophage sp.]